MSCTFFKMVVLGLTLFCSIGAQAKPVKSFVIYGEDNRLDLFQVQNENLINMAKSTAMLIEGSQVTIHGEVAQITASKFTDRFDPGLCQNERFREQFSAGDCSGFLVSPSVLVTAGHCIRSSGSPTSDCERLRIVFGYGLHNQNSDLTQLPANDVYSCKRVMGQHEDESGADYAVIELDRPVRDRTPLKFRKSGVITPNTDLVIIGHPSGLPTKVSGGAKVRSLNHKFFVANLDSYGGNSGSAVFNATTNEVEGILVRGETDFEMDGNCMVSVKCADDGCRGEDVTKITEILPHLPHSI